MFVLSLVILMMPGPTALGHDFENRRVYTLSRANFVARSCSEILSYVTITPYLRDDSACQILCDVADKRAAPVRYVMTPGLISISLGIKLLYCIVDDRKVLHEKDHAT